MCGYRKAYQRNEFCLLLTNYLLIPHNKHIRLNKMCQTGAHACEYYLHFTILRPLF